MLPDFFEAFINIIFFYIHIKRGSGRINYSGLGLVRKVFRKKGQGSVEFIILLIVVLFIFLFVIGLNTDYIEKISGDYSSNLVKTSLNDVYVSANQVYKQGSGAKTTVFINLPKGLVSSFVSDKQISYKMNLRGYNNDYFRSFGFQVFGDLPLEEGIHTLTIEAHEGYVTINEKFLDISPVFLTSSARISNLSTANIYFTSKYNGTLNVTAAFFGDAELNTNLTYPKSFIISFGENFTFPVRFIVPSYSAKKRLYGVFKLNVSNAVLSSSDIVMVDFVVDVMQGLIEVQNNAAFIYPTRWDNFLVPNQSDSQEFILCSGYPALESYDVTFSTDLAGGWMSFTPPGTNRTNHLIMNISSNTCDVFTVYERGGAAIEGNYAGAVMSQTSDGTLMSSLIYTTIYADNTPPNITGFNVSTNYGIIDDLVCIYVNVSDNTEIGNVWVSYLDPLNISHDLYLKDDSICPNSTGYYAGSFELDEPGIYYLNVTYASDISNNIANFSIEKVIFSKKVIFRETPVFAIEEEGRPGRESWDAAPFSALDDGNFAVTSDGGNPPVPPDYVEFTWGDFNVEPNETISQLKFTYVHRDRFNDDGVIDYNSPSQDYRHKIECWYNGNWLFLETYGLNRDSSVWNNYQILDISQCIDDPADLDGFKMRVTFDPADNAGGSYSDLDFVELKAVTTVSDQPLLFEVASDYPQPVDFTGGINATRNSFGILSKHGWDFNDSVYGDSGSTPVNFATYSAPSSFSGCVSPKCTVTLQKRLEIRMGTGSSTEIMSSGAWGTSFNITDMMYNLISKGAKLYYSFTYYVEDLDKDLEEACWVKARFNGVYLGSDIDGHPDFYLHYSDDAFDIWALTDLNHPNGIDEVVMRSYGTDVTSLIEGPGWYTLDFGGKIDFRLGDHQLTEGCGFYFDNIRLMIVDE